MDVKINNDVPITVLKVIFASDVTAVTYVSRNDLYCSFFNLKRHNVKTSYGFFTEDVDVIKDVTISGYFVISEDVTANYDVTMNNTT
jgi:hypothetical protein